MHLHGVLLLNFLPGVQRAGVGSGWQTGNRVQLSKQILFDQDAHNLNLVFEYLVDGLLTDLLLPLGIFKTFEAQPELRLIGG